MEKDWVFTKDPMRLEYSCPLSPMQYGMLFHYLYEQQSGTYIEQIICSLREILNVSALIQSWQRIVERHPILRTSFDWDNSHHLQQLTYEHIKLSIEPKDWRKLTELEQESQLKAYLETDRQHGFALGEVPLIRLTLFQFAEQDYKLVWTFHHALLDGRSMVTILKEVFAFYQAFCQNQQLRLDTARPYRDYIDWLEQQSLTAAENFWRQRLQGFEVPIRLSVSKAADVQTASYNIQTIRLSKVCTSALQAFAQENQLTLNTVVQGAWALLLSRYSGKDDVVFGATRACRYSALENMELMVGLFINTLPVRVQVNSDRSLLQWLKELRSQWIALRQYEHTPLAKIQQWSEIPTGLPLFESLVVFENYELNAELRRQGGKWNNREFTLLDQPNYPLTLAVYAESELSLKINYDCRRFDDDTIYRILRHLETLLQGFIAHSQQCLSDLPLLTPAETHQQLEIWNQTQTEYPREKCLHELFEEQAEQTPDAVSVIYAEQQLTYQELNQRANQLANYLQSLGVGSDVLVGICVERSLEMVVGLLGVLKAGGAYVPLDPSYPQERLQFMLGDAQIAVLLTQERLLEILPTHGYPLVCLDRDWSTITQAPSGNLHSQATANNLAYVIYTSGSTGQPKGVMIPHRAICNHMYWMQQTFPLDATDRVLQKTPFSFDASVWEFYAPLLAGAQLVLAQPGRHQDKDYLIQTIADLEITILQLVPSLLRLLLLEKGLSQYRRPNSHRRRSLRRVFCGGEVLSGDLQQQFFSQLDASLHNLYGPTEACIDSTYWTCQSGHLQKTIPIGRPIANVQTYILDLNLQLVPIGVAGELYIGGVGLARGYLNRPELTAAKFIANPFGDGRLYKTGDLARYCPDGNIEFLDRIDRQVKVRGFRIELGEIEAVLCRHPDLQDAIVVVLAEGSEDKRLVAYIVTRERKTVSSAQLRRFLQQRLPNYMVPAAFVPLEKLPLMPNGKVNRNALPMPEVQHFASKHFVAPVTATEERLAGIWTTVLKLDRVGIHDNFFELGGHSLLATQTISRISEEFGLNLLLRNLFEAPTIAELGDCIDILLWAGTARNTLLTSDIERGEL